MNLSIKKLIDTGAIICGRIIKEDGIVKFERIESSQIESIPKEAILLFYVKYGIIIYRETFLLVPVFTN